MGNTLMVFVFLLMANITSFCTLQSVQGETYVYICTGGNAYRYHCNSECSGLNRCHAEIKKVTLEYAKSKRRTPCRICY